MKIAVCDDNEIQLDLMNKYIKEWAKKGKVDIYIDTFKSAEEFLFKWEDYQKYDIIFLDIEMQMMSGVELSNIIRKRNKIVDIVFATGIFKYALHGYKVGALQYLLKPIKKEDIAECLDNTKNRIKDENDISKYITIEMPKKSMKLNYDNIQYCIMFSPYIDIHTTSDKITLRKKISDIEALLPKETFIRCHRSYLVNLKYIKTVTKDNIILDSGVKIPISRGKYNEVNDAFINYFCE
ncbi:LytTR family DNA-binding domain-containing protein [Clostridium sp.]|uniref:LytR/AlgR family response regulator transcription factor n=1 Tax=Clostridium sp. TaxID=1506 RepID=UPI00260F5629|nr:LytTR family DNA-binding domain-containing protein [Clostridium sp.]